MASVSVSHLVLFIASLVIAAGVVGTVTTGVDRVSAAVEDGSLEATEQLRTDVTVISDPAAGVYDPNAGTDGNITLLVKNVGSQRLAPTGAGLDVVFDGQYVPPSAMTGTVVSVDGAAVWGPGDVLRLTIDIDQVEGIDALAAPSDHRVRIVVNGDEETFPFRVEEA
mgnify:FL=1